MACIVAHAQAAVAIVEGDELWHADAHGWSLSARAVSSTAWFSLLYLIVAGSVVAFTAYVWLIHHESPTKVGTYAYVNPIVAVLLGYFRAGEPLGARTILGTLFVLLSVLMITTSKAKKPAVEMAVARK